jgi:hypothetical protein
MYQIGTCRRIFELIQAHKLVALALAGGLLAASCGASLRDNSSSDTDRNQASERMGNSVTDTSLPINQRFRNLDEYLANLERLQGPVGGPWYKEISPGQYQLQTGNLHLDVPSHDKRNFTREELEKQFGFSK